tara:strand:+ start:150 stop:509 length:360 start_codon:yes stop_codon:yes gene_type:complete
MEIGFYHPIMGYWQTLNQPSNELLAAYPQGTTEVPLKPSGLHTFDGTGWVAPTQAELDTSLAISIRSERNATLAATDYMGLADYPANAGELEYRQALRDVPQQAGFPDNIIWPTQEVLP